MRGWKVQAHIMGTTHSRSGGPNLPRMQLCSRKANVFTMLHMSMQRRLELSVLGRGCLSMRRRVRRNERYLLLRLCGDNCRRTSYTGSVLHSEGVRG